MKGVNTQTYLGTQIGNKMICVLVNVFFFFFFLDNGMNRPVCLKIVVSSPFYKPDSPGCEVRHIGFSLNSD